MAGEMQLTWPTKACRYMYVYRDGKSMQESHLNGREFEVLKRFP